MSTCLTVLLDVSALSDLNRTIYTSYSSPPALDLYLLLLCAVLTKWTTVYLVTQGREEQGVNS